MPKIVVKRKAEVYKEFPIRPFQSRISVGSEGDNDLVIADKKVSMHHLVIEKEGTCYFVQDNHSAFGSYLNGEKIIDRTMLSSGDEIVIGEHSLVFENILFEKNVIDDQPAESPDTEFEDLKPIAKPSTNVTTISKLDELESSDVIVAEEVESVTPTPSMSSNIKPEKLAPHYLLTIYGPYLGKKYRLNYGITRIGRDKTLNDIVIRENSKGEVDPSISRRHATIYMEDGKYFIMDKRSKTRTHVNQQQLGEEDAIQLFPNDEIEIVSDQQSTIFRFVPEGLIEFSPPKKAGFWWIRNSHWVIQAVSGVVVVFLLALLINCWGKLSIINQKPAPLIFSEQRLAIQTTMQDIPLQPGEIVPMIPSLTPAIADLNSDGYLDLVYEDKAGYLMVINGKTSKPLWKNLLPYRLQLPLGVVIADLNQDHKMDILIPSDNSIIYAVDGSTGTEIWSSPLFGGIFSGNPVIADLNGDGFEDIFICNQTGEIHVGYGGFGNPEWSTLQVEAAIKCTPSAGDIDNDGLPEVMVGTENGKVLIFDGAKDNFSHIVNINEEFQKAKGSFFEEHPIRQRIAIGKLNSDGYDDFVVLTEQNHIIAMDGKELKRFWFDQLERQLSGGTLAPPALADLNNDGRLDVVIVTYGNTIVAYDGYGKGAGQKKINWGYIPDTKEEFVSYPVLVDINKDKCADVVVAGFSGGLYIFNGRDGKLLNVPEPIQAVEAAIIGTPLVADFNRDENLDVLLRKNDGSFSLIKTNSQVERSAVMWGQINFDARQAGANVFPQKSGVKFYLAIFFSLLSLAIIIGYNAFEPIRRRNLFIKTLSEN